MYEVSPEFSRQFRAEGRDFIRFGDFMLLLIFLELLKVKSRVVDSPDNF